MIHQFSFDEVVPNLNFDISLEPDKRVYCFIGKNGVGKTKMLEALAKSVLYAHSIFQAYHQSVAHSAKFMLQATSERLSHLTVSFPRRIAVNHVPLYHFGGGQFRLEQFVKRETALNEFRCSKPFLFISAKGRGYLAPLDYDKTPAKDLLIGSGEKRFTDVLEKSLNSINGKETSSMDVVLWLVQRTMINASNAEALESEVITLLHLLKKIEPSWDIISKKNSQNSQANFESEATIEEAKVWYNARDGQVMLGGTPIETLSTGYSSILRLFQEIISSYSAWINGDGDLSQVEGIVFIDEIESHLHAEWQSRIIPLLKKSFPKTTFYIATHSPLIVASTERDEAYELVRNEESGIVNAKKLGNPRGWYLADMLETAFHVDIDSVRNGSASDVGKTLRNFSGKVKEYQKTPSQDLKVSIEALYDDLLQDLAESDPRRRSAAALKELVE